MAGCLLSGVYLLTGCAAMQITPAPGQNLVYSQGKAMVLCQSQKSEKPAVCVAGEGPYQANLAMFTVGFRNHASRPVDFGLENISAVDGNGKLIKIYTPQEIQRGIQTQAAIQAFAVGMNAGSQAFAAAQPSYTSYSGSYSGTSNYNAYNRYGQPVGSLQGYQSGYGYGSATTYNPAQQVIANQAIQANTANQMNMIGNQMQGALGIVGQMLARTTVPPSALYQGIVIVKKSAATNFKINVAGREYTAAFLVK